MKGLLKKDFCERGAGGCINGIVVLICLMRITFFNIKFKLRSYRYFVLSQYQTSAESKIRCRIVYKLKSDSPTFKGCFELIPGCIVTDVQASGLSVGNSKLSKKMFTFWIVWPIDKNSKQEKLLLEESDHPNNSQQTNFAEIGRSGDGDYESGGEDDKNNARRDKDLKKILAQQELESQRVLHNRSRAEEQIASHQAHDNNVSLGVKIAAVAAGGAVSVLLYHVPIFH